MTTKKVFEGNASDLLRVEKNKDGNTFTEINIIDEETIDNNSLITCGVSIYEIDNVGGASGIVSMAGGLNAKVKVTVEFEYDYFPESNET